MCDLCPDLQKLHLLETSVRDVAETKTAEHAFTLSEIANDFKKLNKVSLSMKCSFICLLF
jgi:hypothetical protein